MKKRISPLILLVFIFICCGCSKFNENVRFGSNMIKYNAQTIEEFGFNLDMISTSKNPKIEFVEFKGTNVQGLVTELHDDTFDEVKNLCHNDYYIKLLGFQCYTEDEYVQIDGVHLKVDSKDIELVFDPPIKHSVTSDDKLNTGVATMGYPLIICTTSYQNTEYFYEYYAEENIILEDFYFNDFLKPTNAILYINDTKVGNLEDLLPINIPQGSNFTIWTNIDFKDDISHTYYDRVYCNSAISYKLESEPNHTIEIKNFIISQNVSNEDDAKVVINILSSKK
ncbi:MAG TPA: hypothetical protein GX392_05800 [Clostridiales bacterium]|nr:hypothetical protein [Clostridiales bacterium]